MRQLFIITALALITLVACSAKKKTTKVMFDNFFEVHDTTVIATINRSYCFGKCPVYNMVIFANGNIKLKAIDHLELKNGDYTSTVSQNKLEAIYNKALEINYFNLNDVYTNEYIQDVPTTITSLLNKETKVIKRIENTWEAPRELKLFEEELHRLIAELKWIPSI
jgi:hypothetical protein